MSINDDQGQVDFPGWDSLDHVNLVNALAKTYSISIDIDEMIAIETILDIKRLLGDKGILEF